MTLNLKNYGTGCNNGYADPPGKLCGAWSSLLKLMAFGLMWELVVAVSYCQAVGVLEINGMLKGRFFTSWLWPCTEFIPWQNQYLVM